MTDRPGTAWLARLLGAPTPAARRAGAHRFTPAEVKAALRQPAADGRMRQIHQCLARVGLLADAWPARQRFRGLENYHQRLPRILTLYCRGWETDAIAAELSLFSTGAGVDRAIDVAAAIIAEQLNRQAAA
jgi:hypothetical protein